MQNEISWDGDHRYFFPEVEDFKEPSSFFQIDDADPSPYSILQNFLEADLIDEIVHQTNTYALQQNVRRWKNLSTPELWQFFGLNLLMGIVQKPSIKDYWSTKELISTKFFNKTMSRNR